MFSHSVLHTKKSCAQDKKINLKSPRDSLKNHNQSSIIKINQNHVKSDQFAIYALLVRTLKCRCILADFQCQ